MKEEKVMNEITNFCEGCSSSNCCPEEECVLYRIENIISEKKKIYQVEIEETLSRIIDVEAVSVEEAIDIVEEQYRNEEIVLDCNDYADYNINVLDCSD